MSVSDASTIPNNTDYNTLTTPGNYRVLSASNARSMANCPVTSAHRLFVETVISGRYVQIVYGNTFLTPEYRRYYDGSQWGDWRRVAYTTDIPAIDRTLAIRGDAADASITGSIRDALDVYAEYQLTQSGLLPLLWYRGALRSDGTLDPEVPLSSSLVTPFIQLDPETVVSYQKNDSVNYVRVFEYDANKTYLRQQSLRAADTVYTVSSDAHYIRLNYIPASSSTVLTPEYALNHFTAGVYPSENTTIPLDLHEIPRSQGVLNAIKRARQMTDIKWAPAATIDRVNIVSGQSYGTPYEYFQSQFLNTRDYTGLPYSSQNFIGMRRSINSFITGAAVAEAKECTDSGYASVDVASYLGTVCVTLLAYALYVPQVNSPNFNKVPGLTKQFDIYSNGAYHDITGIQLCDVLWASGHVALITDIVRDSSGSVLAVEVSESTKYGSYIKTNSNSDFGGKCRRKMWSAGDFLRWFRSFAVYRYADEWLDAIPYTPNKYVPMVDETSYVEQHVMPVLPNEGDYAKYLLANGERSVTVLINTTGYEYLHVLKNGAHFSNVSITGLSSVVVQCDASAEAVYEAYLCNMTNGAETTTSESCHWLMVGSATDRTVHNNGDGSYTFSFKRDIDLCHPMAVIYNGTNVNSGQFTVVKQYTKTRSGSKWQYTFTVSPPETVQTFNTVSLLLDYGDYGIAPTAEYTPTAV